jgi:hypothetical protein
MLTLLIYISLGPPNCVGAFQAYSLKIQCVENADAELGNTKHLAIERIPYQLPGASRSTKPVDSVLADGVSGWLLATLGRDYALMNSDYERVYYKNDFSFVVAILNLYMVCNGTDRTKWL